MSYYAVGAAPKPMPKTFDTAFEKYRGGVPVELMRVLSMKESGMNPNSDEGSARGLMQVVESVRKDYNKANGTDWSRADLLIPEVNVAMAASLLNRITRAYGKHPDINMQMNWDNPEFVKLLIAGWNSGYSEAGGVGKVAKWLEARKKPVTHDNVFAFSADAKATKHLRNEAKQRWQRGVVSAYFAERAATGSNNREVIRPDLGAMVKTNESRITVKSIMAGFLGLIGLGWLFTRD